MNILQNVQCRLQMPRIARAVAVGAAVALSAGVANAGSISTPILFLGSTNQLICIANNVGKTTLTLKVRIVGQTSSSTETCTLPAGDRDGCQGFLNNQSGYCKIIDSDLSTNQLKSQVRGVMFTRSTSAPFALEAVVQAE